MFFSGSMDIMEEKCKEVPRIGMKKEYWIDKLILPIFKIRYSVWIFSNNLSRVKFLLGHIAKQKCRRCLSTFSSKRKCKPKFTFLFLFFYFVSYISIYLLIFLLYSQLASQTIYVLAWSFVFLVFQGWKCLKTYRDLIDKRIVLLHDREERVFSSAMI